ncbi:MAG: serine/threonine protein kinase [Planctomycetes bacterium]|nr:serine/threonine protein kinase [Planctomycetota bacterium]
MRPRQLGNYDLLEEIGRGAFGVVYRCRERATGRELALKVLDHLQGERPRQRFEREGQALAQLDHPSIVRVHAAVWEGDSPHLALELVTGEDLEQRLERSGPLDPAEARELLVSLAEAVAHAHERSVLHRDIKPSNVLLAQDGRPMLLDFGLASLADTERLTLTGQMIGTPAYMAPEQARGKWDERTDVYGLGALLYACLTGEAPARGDTVAECLVKVMSGPAPDPGRLRENLPRGLVDVCRRCLAKDPAARYPSALDLADALRASSRVPQRLDPKLLAVAVGSLLALVLLAALLLGGSKTSPSPAESPEASLSLASASPTPTTTRRGPRPLTDSEWNALLLDPKTREGELDFEWLASRTAPKQRGRLRALEAMAELRAGIRRGAPWRDLRIGLKNVRRDLAWPELERSLPWIEAQILADRGRGAEALKRLVGDESPQAAWIRLEVADHRGEARLVVTRMLTLARGSGPISRVAQARRARLGKQLDAAIELGRGAPTFDPSHLELAIAYMDSKLHDHARRSLNIFSKRWGPTPTTMRLRAEIARAEGRLTQALELIRRGVALLEVDRDLYLDSQHARILVGLERPQDAVRLLEPQVPPRSKGEVLSIHQVRVLVLLGWARYVRLETRLSAREPWARAQQGNSAVAKAALPPEAGDKSRHAFAAANTLGARWESWRSRRRDSQSPSPVPAAKGSARDVFAARGVEYPVDEHSVVQILGQLPKGLAQRFAPPPGSSSTVQDLCAAEFAAVSGKDWSTIRFLLSRALESGKKTSRVRATWLRLALARERDLGKVAERLRGDESQRYGVDADQKSLFLADLAWGQGRVGEARVAYSELARRRPATLAGELAGACYAILRGSWVRAEAQVRKVLARRPDAAYEALLGITLLGQGKVEQAARSQRAAYAGAGARDHYTLALRAALLAGAEIDPKPAPQSPIALPKQLRLGGAITESLALRAALDSRTPQRILWARSWLEAKSKKTPDALLLFGYALVLSDSRIGADKAVTDLWERVRRGDRKLHVPLPYLLAYRRAFLSSSRPRRSRSHGR